MLVAGALLAAACGSSTKSAGTPATTKSASGTTAAASATTKAGSAATTAAASGATTVAAAGSDSLAKAKATVAEFSKRPTKIPNSVAISKAIPAGKKVYFISCGAPACESEIPLVKQAADILGWTLTAISTDGSPQQTTAAWDRVVREKPDGVLYTGTARSQIADQMKQAAANGTAVSGCCVTDPATDGLLYTISTPAQVGELGKVMASWIVADSNGGTPGVVYLDLPDFPILGALQTELKKNLGDLCAKCAYSKIDFGLADLGTAADRVVSFLRANPTVKYVIQSTDSTFSLPAALEAANLKDIRIFGEGPTSATLADIQAGRQAGTMAFAFYEVMFSLMDSLARKFAGVDQDAKAGPPNWILTKGAFPVGADTFPLVEDVVAQYKKLWGK